MSKYSPAFCNRSLPIKSKTFLAETFEHFLMPGKPRFFKAGKMSDRLGAPNLLQYSHNYLPVLPSLSYRVLKILLVTVKCELHYSVFWIRHPPWPCSWAWSSCDFGFPFSLGGLPRPRPPALYLASSLCCNLWSKGRLASWRFPFPILHEDGNGTDTIRGYHWLIGYDWPRWERRLHFVGTYWGWRYTHVPTVQIFFFFKKEKHKKRQKD